MGKKKKPEKYEVKLTATCPYCNVVNEIDHYDFTFFSDSCGTHDTFELYFKCKECNTFVDHTLI